VACMSASQELSKGVGEFCLAPLIGQFVRTSLSMSWTWGCHDEMRRVSRQWLLGLRAAIRNILHTSSPPPQPSLEPILMPAPMSRTEIDPVVALGVLDWLLVCGLLIAGPSSHFASLVVRLEIAVGGGIASFLPSW